MDTQGLCAIIEDSTVVMPGWSINFIDDYDFDQFLEFISSMR
jgi:aminoglycoside N3'-acetyltransferase